MIANISTVAFIGITPKVVDVQVSITKGLPSFNIVGLADKAISESKERLRSAFAIMNIALPACRITVNLSPANILKEGSHFDLPIAIAILAAIEIIPLDDLSNFLAMGEIALDGKLSNINGVLPAAILCADLKKHLIFPSAVVKELQIVKDNLQLLPFNNLKEIISFFKGNMYPNINDYLKETPTKENIPDIVNFATIKGQEIAKRALTVAAAGGHNVLMIGPPGSGKSMLAQAFASILPDLTSEEVLEISLIYSVAGELRNRSFVSYRPFRSPHNTSSSASIIGGGVKIKPGEVTLAHKGVLFLDEFAEFSTNVIDALRQPLESGEIHISRVNSSITYPANFQLIAAMNPCKCGYFGDANRQCSKAPSCVEKYQHKISGPILDRIDIVVEVTPVSVYELSLVSKMKTVTSAEIKERVTRTRNLQIKRAQEKNLNSYINGRLSSEALDKITDINAKALELLQRSVVMWNLSNRAYFKILKVARTCADLDNSPEICAKHMAEAIGYRKINYYNKKL